MREGRDKPSLPVCVAKITNSFQFLLLFSQKIHKNIRRPDDSLYLILIGDKTR